MKYVAFALALLSASIAHATDDARALKALEQGVALFNAGKLEPARDAFVRARDLAPSRSNPYRYLGLVEVKLGHCAAALEAFDKFLALVAASDPRRTEATTLRDRCADELAPKTGALDVETTPTGAVLHLDDESGAPTGTTPFHAAALVPGAHVVFVARDGYRPRSKGVTVAAGATAKLALTLEALPPPPPNLELPPPATHPGPPIVDNSATAPAPLKKTRWWIAAVVVGAAVVVAGAAVGIAYGGSSTGTHETVVPPIN